jgi:alpha-N-acetylglucosamine transferase
MASISILVTLFVGAVYLFTHNTPIFPADVVSADLGPKSKESVFNVNWDGAYPAERTAYVYTYAPGRWDDQQRLIGIRTSIEALKNTGTRRDIVVLVTPSVDIVARDTLKQHGAKIIEMPSIAADPITDHNSNVLGVCKVDFAPIHVWGLYEKYDRVVWFDSDVLPQLKVSHAVIHVFLSTFSSTLRI